MPDFSGFEWDENKRRANVLKHGIDFVVATEVFADPDHFTFRSPSKGEDRLVSIGRAEGRLLAVVFTERGGKIRIISARAARTKERERYGR